jgi:hypothetical protein
MALAGSEPVLISLPNGGPLESLLSLLSFFSEQLEYEVLYKIAFANYEGHATVIWQLTGQ